MVVVCFNWNWRASWIVALLFFAFDRYSFALVRHGVGLLLLQLTRAYNVCIYLSILYVTATKYTQSLACIFYSYVLWTRVRVILRKFLEGPAFSGLNMDK